MKRKIRIVFRDRLEEDKQDEYYCEYFNGRTWNCEVKFICAEENLINEGIIWWIHNKMRDGYQFEGIIMCQFIDGWKPWRP
jgi:hypothetical protein